MHSKSVLTVDNVGSAWYVRLILKICISKFFKIIKSKIQKTLIHLETVVLFRLNRIERKGRLNRLFSDPKKKLFIAQTCPFQYFFSILVIKHYVIKSINNLNFNLSRTL